MWKWDAWSKAFMSNILFIRKIINQTWLTWLLTSVCICCCSALWPPSLETRLKWVFPLERRPDKAHTNTQLLTLDVFIRAEFIHHLWSSCCWLLAADCWLLTADCWLLTADSVEIWWKPSFICQNIFHHLYVYIATILDNSDTII